MITAEELGQTLQLDGVTYAYRRDEPVLRSVTCSFTSPAIAVLGPNGAGKSTLLRLLMTASSPQQGSFRALGWSSSEREGLRDFRRQLGVMPQSLRILGGYSCLEFLHYVAWLREVPTEVAERNVEDALGAVDLWDRRDQRVKELSGGMRQRLGLAQALVNRPGLLVLDEPTVGLDPRQRIEFRKYLTRLLPKTAIVLATHLVEDVAAIAQEVLVLDAGVVRYAGPLTELSGVRDGGELTGKDIESAYMRLVGPEQ